MPDGQLFSADHHPKARTVDETHAGEINHDFLCRQTWRIEDAEFQRVQDRMWLGVRTSQEGSGGFRRVTVAVGLSVSVYLPISMGRLSLPAVAEQVDMLAGKLPNTLSVGGDDFAVPDQRIEGGGRASRDQRALLAVARINDVLG